VTAVDAALLMECDGGNVWRPLFWCSTFCIPAVDGWRR